MVRGSRVEMGVGCGSELLYGRDPARCFLHLPPVGGAEQQLVRAVRGGADGPVGACEGVGEAVGEVATVAAGV